MIHAYFSSENFRETVIQEIFVGDFRPLLFLVQDELSHSVVERNDLYIHRIKNQLDNLRTDQILGSYSGINIADLIIEYSLARILVQDMRNFMACSLIMLTAS